MIGRTEQVAQICAQIEAITAGNAEANVLFVTGEAGIGKSTLLAAVRDECARMPRPPLVAMVECSTPLAGQDIGEVESLQPWGELMARLVTSRPEKHNETRKLVGELAAAWIKVVPVVGDVLESIIDTTKIVKEHMDHRAQEQPAVAANQQQIFQQYVNFLAKLSEQGPAVLMIDDFHWADTSSTNLLFTAARQLQGKPVLFVIAYRPDDAASSRGGEGHPILHIRNELGRYSLAAEVGVPRLTPEDLDALLRARYASYRNNDEFERWLAHVSDGNALFISQFLNTLEEDGYIDRGEGTIHEGFDSIRVPASAQAVVQERIRRLSEETKELLRYASVEGDTFTAAVLAKITETPQLKLLQKLRLIEESHQLIRSMGKQRVYARETSTFQFAHMLLHKAMYDNLGEEERELLHEAVLDVLKEEWETAREEGSNIEGIAARLAVHAEVLGQNLFAAEVLLEGARAAWKEFAADETLRLLDGVLTFMTKGEKPPKNDPHKGERLSASAHFLRSSVLKMQARIEPALDDIRAARALFESAGESQRVVDSMVNEAMLLRRREDRDSARETAMAALAEAQRIGYPDGECLAMTTIGHAEADEGSLAEALDWYKLSLELVRTKGLSGTREAGALDNIGIMHDSLGNYAEAAACYDQSLRIVLESGDIAGEGNVLLNLGVLHWRTGNHDEARRCFLRCREIAAMVGDTRGEVSVASNLGVIEFHAGNHREAGEHYARALEIARTIGDRRAEAPVLSNLGELYQALGEMQLAREHFERSLAIRREIDDREGIATASLNLAYFHAKMGESAPASEYIESALGLASEIGGRELEAMALGCRGLVEAIDAADAGDAGRPAKLASATAHLDRCIAMLRELDSMYVELWEQERAGVTGEKAEAVGR